MRRVINVKCPMALTLFLNVETIEPDIKVKMIKQTVALQNTNIMDEIEIKKNNNDTLEIVGDIDVLEKDKFLNTIKLFEEKSNIEVRGLTINIKRICMRVACPSNIIAGLLIGLNEFYHTNFSFDDLKRIGYKVDNISPYFLVGGFKKIDEAKGEMIGLSKNCYQNYIIVDKNEEILLPNPEEIKKYGVVSKDSKDNFPYSDYEKIVGDNYTEIKQFLKEYKEIVSSVLGNTSLYVVTSKDNLLLSRMNYRLKHEFPNYSFYQVTNVNGPKVLIKNS